jgi:phospholipid/cholesterol/gamma-HCH transport system permease protein
MQVNEEIDALRTLGIPPEEFLVLPRLLAVSLMLPLLCCYADLMGILGGALVGSAMFEMTPMQYYQQTLAAVPLRHFGVGLVKSAVYGVVVALSGCLRGMQCERSASAVGEATTAAVVTAIIWIVVWCALLTVAAHVLGV